MTDRTPIDPDAFVGYALVRVAHALERRFARAVGEAGLTARQFSVLALLDTGPPASVGALARRVLITPQSMGELLEALARRGLVDRTAPAGRGHPAGVRVTAAGRRALADAAPRVADLEAQVTAGLGADEVAALRTALATVLANVAGDEGSGRARPR